MQHNEDQEQPLASSQRGLLDQQVAASNIRSEDHTLRDDLRVYRRKRLQAIIIGGIAVAVVLLVIILPVLISRKGHDPHPPPGPTPGPPGGDKYNPYYIDMEDGSWTQHYYGLYGVIRTHNNDTNTTQQEQLRFLRHQNRVQLQQSADDNDTKKMGVDWKKIPFGENNQFIQNINFAIEMVGDTTAKLTLTDNDKTRFSIPESITPKPFALAAKYLENMGFDYSLDPFGLVFRDPVDHSNVFIDTRNQTLVLSDKFIQMDLLLSSTNLYGFGERTREFRLSEGAFTMWANGQQPTYDDGRGRKGSYGVHPFLLGQGKKQNQYFGIYFRNANAQTPVIRYTDDKQQATLSYITIGGNLEVYFMVYGTAKQIIQQYHNIIGKPYLPPFYALGWQQSSKQYTLQSLLEAVIEGYQDNNVPLDVIHLDTSYLDIIEDFKVNLTAFSDLKSLDTKMKEKNIHLVVGVKPTISAVDIEKNNAYIDGNENNCFIKSSHVQSAKYNNNLVSLVDGQKAVFVDFGSLTCDVMFWKSGIWDLNTQTLFDGIMLDNNEPTTDVSGEINPDTQQLVQSRLLQQSDSNDTFDLSWFYSFQDQKESSTYNLPFVPYFDSAQNFDQNTISLNGTHNDSSMEYDYHSLYGIMQSIVTYGAINGDDGISLLADKRPFLISRSTFASSGNYVSHVGGNNQRTWEMLRYSIANLYNMNMFGIPHYGDNVCGSYGIELLDQELCLRWIQLATFYPLARSHYEINSTLTEPYNIENETIRNDAITSIRDRYQYLRYMYTKMFETHQNGGSFIDPLFFYFPEASSINPEDTFMVGDAIKVSPILDKLAENQTTFKSYFPAGNWVNLANYSDIVVSKGEVKDLNVQTTVNAHLRPGYLIPVQSNITGLQVNNTNDLINWEIKLVANPDEYGVATGTVFLDKGISVKEISDKLYEYYRVNIQNNSIQFQLVDGTKGQQTYILNSIRIVNSPKLSTVDYACFYDKDLNIKKLNVTYNQNEQSLLIDYTEIVNETQQYLLFNQVQNIYFGDSTKDQLNLCDAATFQYDIVGGQVPDLDTTSASFLIQNTGKVPLPQLKVDVRFVDEGIINMKWTWAPIDENTTTPAGKKTPVDVPQNIVNTDTKTSPNQNLSSFIAITATPFTITFTTRLSDEQQNAVYLQLKRLVFDSYLNWINMQVTTTVTGDNFKGIFGLGERVNGNDIFYNQDGMRVYSLWNKDNLPRGLRPDQGTLPASQGYSTHPFYMYKFADNSWVGVFTKIAQAQDWYINNNRQTGAIDINTIATGGIADIYVFTPASLPDSIIKKYHSLVGSSVMIPQWVLGWHQSKWGYSSLEELEANIAGYEKEKIPLDTQWCDSFYKEDAKEFVLDNNTFSGLPKFVDDLHNKSMKFVPIIDPGISIRTGYKTYEDGAAQGVFLKIANETYIGKVWPDKVAFPDFCGNPNTETWWQSQLTDFHNQVKYDGLWLDMNEVSNFCTGICDTTQLDLIDHKLGSYLPYTPSGMNLEQQTMSLDVQSADGNFQLDTHSLYGTCEVKVTSEWYTKQQKRSYVLSRSSFAGAGKFGTKWLGDNSATDGDMGWSVTGVMMMNMFGIPVSGVDICGFALDTNANLCTRWHTVGAFYPFSRNHNMVGQKPQEPYIFTDKYEGDLRYVDIMRSAIQTKYSLIRHYYTQLMLQNLNGGGAIYKPLFFSFPNDVNAFENITNNIMIGDALKVSVDAMNSTSTENYFYFPQGVWCNLIDPSQKCNLSSGQTVLLPAKLNNYYMHLRAGYIVPMQDAAKLGAMTTAQLQNQPVDFHILGESNDVQGWIANGIYYNDDGETVTPQDGNSNTYRIKSTFTSVVSQSLQVVFTMTSNATNYENKTEDGTCYAVNQNDYLGTIYFYYASSFNNNTATYNVQITKVDGTLVTDAGQATLDAGTDRIIYTPKQPLCISTITSIQMTPASPTDPQTE